MHKTALWASLLLFSAFMAKPLYADSCEDNFKVSGDPRNGASYVTFVTLPNLDPHSALGQMEKISLDMGFVIGSENYEGDMGTLTIIQKDKNNLLHPHKGFPVMIRANKADNRLAIALQLNQGQTANADTMRSTLCGMLSKVTMDSAGAAVADAAHAQTHSDEITNIKAPDLASQMSKAMIGHALHPEIVEDQYMGRVYRIDGQVSISMTPGEAVARSQSIQNGSHSFDISYDTRKTALLGGKVDTNTAIVCHSDPGQMDRFLALRNGDYATLIGKVTQFAGTTYGGTLYLDCHFEN
jgi:hypothetical protein